MSGTVKLVGTNIKKITSALDLLLTNKDEYEAMSFAHNPYGDGKACIRICDILAKIKKDAAVLNYSPDSTVDKN